MSGIAGIIHFDGAPFAPGLVDKMTLAMAYRGPDGIHHWSRGSVALGQCMLRTTQESLEEHQPLTNEDESLVLVLDGRVDNWEELRQALLAQGTMLRDRSDAELILRAYETWGRDFLRHIDGDFALVIWDARRQEAICARDRIGSKPFHYHWDGKTFAFSSEVHPLLALPWVKQELNEGMVAEFLAAEWYSRDETFWLGIMRLVAANHMAVGASGPRPEKYWAPDLWATLPYAKDGEYVEHYRELFVDVVRRMSRSSHPVACEVSGGLDSSAIFAVAEHLRHRQELPAPALEGYTLDFHDDADANELEYCRAVGSHLGVQIQEIPPSIMTVSWYQGRAAAFRDFPGSPNGVMGLGIRKEAQARGSRVLLTGVGGDEWLVGNRTYYGEGLAAREWAELSGFVKADWDHAGPRSTIWWIFRYGACVLLPATAREILRNMFAHRRNSGIDMEAWLSPALRRVMKERREKYCCANTEKVRRIGQRGQLFHLSSAFLAMGRETEERLSSEAGLELRRPFFDPRMVQFSLMTPEKLRLRGRIDKAMHRQAMKGMLPELVLKRETKADFAVTYLRHLAEMKALLTEQITNRRRNWVKSGKVATLYSQHGDRSYSSTPEWMLWFLFACDALVLQTGQTATIDPPANLVIGES